MICPEYKAAAMSALLSRTDRHHEYPHPRTITLTLKQRSWKELITCDEQHCQYWAACDKKE